MSKENDPDREMEHLSKAIVEAILGSDDVKKALEKLNTSEDTLGKNFMVFVVSLDSLNDAKKGAKNHELGDLNDIGDMPEEMPKPRRRRPVKRADTPDHIDGEPLSKNEKNFRDMLSDHFDSEAWLKSLKLRLD